MRRWEKVNFALDERGKNRKIAGLVMAKIFLDYELDVDKFSEYLRYYDGLMDMAEEGPVVVNN